MSRGGIFWSVAGGVALRTLRSAIKNPAIMLPSVLFPLFFFSAFAGGLSRVSKVPNFGFPSGYTAFQFVFVFVQASAFGGVFTGFGIARDFERGFAKRLLLAAPSRGGILAGYAIAALGRAAIVLTVVTTVALIAGMHVDGGPLDFLGLVVLAVLTNLAAVLFAAGVAMRLRSMQAGPLMQTPVFLLLFLSPVYVPLPLLHGWVHTVASVNPARFMLEAGRGFISGTSADAPLAFAVIVGLLAAALAWGVRGLRAAERDGG